MLTKASMVESYELWTTKLVNPGFKSLIPVDYITTVKAQVLDKAPHLIITLTRKCA